MAMEFVRREVILCYREEINKHGLIVARDRDKKEGLKALKKGQFMDRNTQRRFIHPWLATEYCVGFYGSARLGETTSDYKWGEEVGFQLTKEFGVSWATGGGPNLMAAPLEGAWRAGQDNDGKSKNIALGSKIVGFTLSGFLNYQEPNKWLQIVVENDDFGGRLNGFMNINHAAIFAWGGEGTWWELFSFLQAKQSHIQHLEIGFPADFPIIVHPRWEKPLQTFFKHTYDLPEEEGRPTVVSLEDKRNFVITDDINQIKDIIAINRASWRDNIWSRVVRDRSRTIRDMRKAA